MVAKNYFQLQYVFDGVHWIFTYGIGNFVTKAFQMNQITAGSISLDNNFKLSSFFSERYKKSHFFALALIKIN